MALYFFHDLGAPRSHLRDQCEVTADELAPFATCPARHLHGRYYRPWAIHRKDSGSTITTNKDKFEVNLDVQHFKPEEINVKVSDNNVIVEGKHEDRKDEHGSISREFSRRYVLPKECDMKNVMSSLSSDGILTITVPKSNKIQGKERVIPITHTGPHKAVEEKEISEQKAKL